jgi:hypothetical protein
MKNIALTLTVVTVGLFAFVGTAAAGPPKADILHCGCNLTGDDMEMKQISISTKSKGHLNHTFSDVDSCFNGVETYTDVMRTHADCSLGDPNLSPNGLMLCSEDGAAETDDCGAAPPVAPPAAP